MKPHNLLKNHFFYQRKIIFYVRSLRNFMFGKCAFIKEDKLQDVFYVYKNCMIMVHIVERS